MERFFTNKRIWKMLIIAFLVIMAVQVMAPTTVVVAAPESNSSAAQGDNSDAAVEEGDNTLWGGVLLRPILSLLVTICDGIMSLLHSTIMGGNASLIHINLAGETSIIEKVLSWVLAIAIVLVVFPATIEILFPALIAVVGLQLIGVPTFAMINKAGETVENINEAITSAIVYETDGEEAPSDLYLPIYSYSPEEIFKGKILLFDIDFFSNEKIVETAHDKDQKVAYYYYVDSEGEDLDTDGDGTTDTKGYKTSQTNSVSILKSIVSSWYVVIRNICIVAMLSVLIYIGIRMMLSSVANEKAKYKEMFKDWLVGLCLLFVMHYIMAFSVVLVGKLTSIINTTVDKEDYYVVLNNSNNVKMDEEKLKNLEKGLEQYGLKDMVEDENGSILWRTNLMGYLRTSLQYDKTNGKYIGEILCLMVLVMYTVLFTFSYLKRLLYMTFLTIISPFVALTYCIDKVNDGQAQGFNTWLKEYIFNLLIQPLHLLLYYVLVTSAFALAGTNVLYSIVAIGFMIPAEKLLRGLFGFEKAHTPPLLGGPIGTALMMTGVKGITNAISKANSRNNLPNSEGKNSLREAKNPNEDSDENSIDENSLFNTFSDETMTSSDTQPEHLDGQHQRLPEMQSASVSVEGLPNSSYTQSRANTGAQSEEMEKSPSLSIRFANSKIGRQARRKWDATINGAGRSLVNKYSKPKTYIKGVKKGLNTTWKTAKGVTIGTMAGATVAGLGTAAAIASGDPSKAITAIGAGAGVGYAAGRGAANSNSIAAVGTAITSHLSDETKAAYDAVYNKEEYKEQDRKDKVKKMRESTANQIKAEQILGKEDAENFTKTGGNMEYWSGKGINDFDDMLAAEQMHQLHPEISREEIVQTIGVHDHFDKKDPTKDSKLGKNVHDTMYRGFKQQHQGISDDDADRAANRVVGNVGTFHEIRERIKN